MTCRDKNSTSSSTSFWTGGKSRGSDAAGWRARAAWRSWTSWCPRSRSPGPCACPWRYSNKSTATTRRNNLSEKPLDALRLSLTAVLSGVRNWRNLCKDQRHNLNESENELQRHSDQEEPSQQPLQSESLQLSLEEE